MYSKQALGNSTIEALFLQFAARQHFFLTTNFYEHKASSLHAWLTPFAFGLGGKSQKYNGALGIYRENLNSRPAPEMEAIDKNCHSASPVRNCD